MTSLNDKDDWEEETTDLDVFQAAKTIETGVTPKSIFGLRKDAISMFGDILKKNSDSIDITSLTCNRFGEDMMTAALNGGPIRTKVTIELDVFDPNIIQDFQYVIGPLQQAVSFHGTQIPTLKASFN